jgi:hypothetical protein
MLEEQPAANAAYVALDSANYIIGSLSGSTRFILWFDGVHGNKKLGMEQLGKTSMRTVPAAVCENFAGLGGAPHLQMMRIVALGNLSHGGFLNHSVKFRLAVKQGSLEVIPSGNSFRIANTLELPHSSATKEPAVPSANHSSPFVMASRPIFTALVNDS